MIADELRDRKARNASYSLRAFARDIGLAPSFLNQILRGARQLTEQRGYILTRRLDWSPERTRRFIQSIRLSACTDPDYLTWLRAEATSEHKDGFDDYRELSVDDFRSVSTWYHYAILEMLDVEGVNGSTKVLAQRFELTEERVVEAIERLVSVGLIEIVDGVPRRTTRNFGAKEVSSAAIRLFHNQVLRRAQRALEDDPSTRDFTAVTMAIDHSLLPDVRRRVREFWASLVDELSTRSTSKSSVYQFGAQIFRLDEPKANAKHSAGNPIGE